MARARGLPLDRVGAVVLAAGAGSRFGGAKQQLLAPEVIRRLREAGIERIVAVEGAHALELDVPVVDCPEWERGPGASLRCGLAALPEDVEAALVVLADGPELDPRAVGRVLAAWDGQPLLAATYGGQRLHPVLVAREAWAGVPDEGLRSLPVEPVPCDDLTPPGDVDFADEIPERLKPPNAES
jgi:CTP:molybdopterin cytidylyltransferase MocA